METRENRLLLPSSGFVEELTFGLPHTEVNKLEEMQRTLLAKERK